VDTLASPSLPPAPAGNSRGNSSGTGSPRRTTPALTGGHDAVRPGASGGSRVAAWARDLVRVPLLAKLIVADVAINLVAFFVVSVAPAEYTTELVISSFVVTLVLNTILIVWALRPLRALEATASRVSSGDLSARVPRTRLSDRNIVRIAHTLNQLLDGVTADRIRLRHLASQVISAGDRERAHIARELHDSTAQSLSALEMLVTSSIREVPASGETAALHERLRVMREVVVESLAEVRTLSHNVHPRVLDDLGLVAALEFLARRTREQSGVGMRVTSDVRRAVPAPVASVLYRVAQEAVRNAVRHGPPSDLHLGIFADSGRATLEVADDGPGFDLAAVEAERRGMGLFVMRERMALIDGRLEIESSPGAGTLVRASAPIDAAAAP
jgi:signal transduction histidine kinase